MNNDWNSINKIPPDKLLEVIDENGNIATAMPAIYPFKLNKKGKGRYDFDVERCEPYWDGSWWIQGENLDNPLTGEIIKWREM